MAEQQPHLEILSRNRINRSTIVIAIVPVSIFSGLAAIALWPFLTWIAYGLLAVLSGCILFLAVLAVIEVRRRWLHAPYIHVDEQNGMFDTSTGRMFPLQLPPPLITEEKEEPVDRIKQALDVLEVHSHGVGIRSIAQSYKDAGDTYWTEWRIRQLVQAQKKA